MIRVRGCRITRDWIARREPAGAEPDSSAPTAVRKHLGACAKCREALSADRRVVALLNQVAPASPRFPGETLKRRLFEQLQSGEAAQMRRVCALLTRHAPARVSSAPGSLKAELVREGAARATLRRPAELTPGAASSPLPARAPDVLKAKLFAQLQPQHRMHELLRQPERDARRDGRAFPPVPSPQFKAALFERLRRRAPHASEGTAGRPQLGGWLPALPRLLAPVPVAAFAAAAILLTLGVTYRRSPWSTTPVAPQIPAARSAGRARALPETGRSLSGILVAYAGEVERADSRSGPWVGCAAGETLPLLTWIRTKSSGRAHLKLSDKSDVKLNSGTVVGLMSGRLLLERGELSAHVTKGATPFLVRTPNGTTQVLGTQFNLSYTPEDRRTQLSVLEGTVYFHGQQAGRIVSSGHLLIAQAAEVRTPVEITGAQKRLLLAWTHFVSGQKALQAGRPEEAVPELRQAVQEAPDHLPSHEALVEALIKSGRLVVVRQADAPAEGMRLAYEYRDGSDVDLSASIEAVRSVVAGKPDSARAQGVLGLLEAVVGEEGPARTHLTRAIELDPYLGEPYAVLGYLEHLRGNNQKAHDLLEKGVALAPTSPTAHGLLGLYSARTGDGQTAVSSFETQVRLDPHDGAAWCHLGLHSWAEGRYDRGFEAAKKAVELRPDSVPFAMVFGRLADQIHRHKEAIPILKKAVDDASGNPEATFWLGVCYLRTGDVQHGQNCLRVALRSDQCNPLVYAEYAKLYLQQSRYRSALAAIAEGLSRHPENEDLALCAEQVWAAVPSEVAAGKYAQPIQTVVASRQANLKGLVDALRVLLRSNSARTALREAEQAEVRGDFAVALAKLGETCERAKVGLFCSLAPEGESAGLTHVVWNQKRGRDGVSVPITYDSVEGRQTNVKQSNHLLYFDVDTEQTLENGAFLLVSVLDRPANSFVVEYDSTDPEGKYKPAGTAQKTGTPRWTYHVFYLPDARFAGRQNGNADFRLRTRGGEDTAVRWACILPAAPPPSQPRAEGTASPLEPPDRLPERRTSTQTPPLDLAPKECQPTVPG